jgi:hypothetical protein
MNKDLRKSIAENFGLVATFLGFVVDSIALVALVNSKIPPSIPFIEYKLDATFQLVLWIIALITYLGFLRERWLRISRKLSTRPESTFSRFIVYDLIARFKYPFLIIPFVFFLGILLPILTQLSFSAWVFIVIITIAFAMTILIATENEKTEKRIHQEWSHLDNENVYILWKNRIEKEMQEKGYVTNVELANLYAERVSYCNKALWRYHKNFELEKDLICVSEFLVKRYGDSKRRLTLWVLAPRKLAGSRPWLEDRNKYFDL